MFKQLFLPIIAVCAFIILVGLLSQGKLNNFLNLPSPAASKKTLKTIKIDNLEIEVFVAKTAGERSKGLSDKESLEEKEGMVFVFTPDSYPVFWMKDTKFPLDIIWINDNKIIKIDKNIPIELDKSDTELIKYTCDEPIDYVLEVNAGFSEKYGIRVDQSLSGLEQL